MTSLWSMDLLSFQARNSFIEVVELVDELATFGIRLPISFIGKKVCAKGHFVVKAFH